MATRLKTVEYWFPVGLTIPDAVATALTQITLYIPESSPVFKSVIAQVIVADNQTVGTNVTQRQISLTLQGASASTVNNTSTLTQSGENFIHQFSGDFTAYFNSNWSGTSRTLDCSLTINASTTGSANASVQVVITYEYDDTSTTHVKTVRIPLNSSTIAQLSAKGAAIDTIPALDTYCPEASKTFRQLAIVVQGNQEAASTTDSSLSFEIDTLGAVTSTLYEKGFNSSSFYRFSDVVTFDTSVTHNFYLWASLTDYDHAQVYLVATYEFNASTTTRVLNSILLPMEFGGGMGGTTSALYQRAMRDLWIQEPGTITLERAALFIFWDQLAGIAGLNMRIGTGSFVAYSSVAAIVCGGCAAMIRNDSVSLARGRNTLQADIYNTDATDRGYNLSSFWMLNYTSDKHTDGVGAHNHTVSWNLKTTGTGAASTQIITAATAFDIPEADHFKNSIGLNYIYTSNTSGNASGVHIGAERLSGEGGLLWENVYETFGGTDAEVGIRQAWASSRSVFRRFVSGSVIDADPERLDIQTARRWRVILGGNCAAFSHLDIYMTYHSITSTVAGTISGSAGGTVTLSLHRASNGEKLMETSRVGDGAYSFTWYDDTEDVYVVATEAALTGMSLQDVAV